MNTTRAALVERFAKGRERAEKEQALTLRVFDLLPADLANDKAKILPLGTSYADALLTLNDHTLSCVPRLLELLPPVERRMVRDGTVSFKALRKLTPRDTAADVYHIAPFTVSISYGEVRVDWYWEAAPGLLVSVWVKFPRSSFLRVDADHRYGRDDRIIEYRWDLSQQAKDWVKATGGDYIRFASGSPKSPNPYTLYWPDYKDASEVFAVPA